MSPIGLGQFDKIVTDRPNFNTITNVETFSRRKSIIETEPEVKKAVDYSYHDPVKKGFGNFRDGIFTHPLLGTSNLPKRI